MMKLTWFRGIAMTALCFCPVWAGAQDHWSQPSSLTQQYPTVAQPNFGNHQQHQGYSPDSQVLFQPIPANGGQPNYGPQQQPAYGAGNSNLRYPPEMRTPPAQNPAAQNVGYSNFNNNINNYNYRQPAWQQDAPHHSPQQQPPAGQNQSGLYPQSNHNQYGPANGSNGFAGCDGGQFNGQFSGQCGSDVGCNGFSSANIFGADDCGSRGRFARAAQPAANWVVGLNYLNFARDYEDALFLSRNNVGEYLVPRDADINRFSGIETVLSRRGCGGSGWEARFWGLFPGRAVAPFTGMPMSELIFLDDVFHPDSGFTALEIFDTAVRHEAVRRNEFYNLEFNALRNGGSFTGLGGKTVNYELLGGFRWFQFNEAFSYIAFNGNPGYPAWLAYDINVRNTLLGLQFGGRTERCLTQRLSLTNGLRGGIFNNNIRHSQWIVDSMGMPTTLGAAPGSPVYNFDSSKNDVAFLGELDFGGAYQFSQRARAVFGYRVIGITGLALAPEQIPANILRVQAIERINSNSSMILHGAYGGLQFCF